MMAAARDRTTQRRSSLLIRAALALALVVGCGDESVSMEGGPPARPSSAATPAASGASTAGGDAARGRALLARYECHRCHEGTGLAPPPLEKQCVGCHRAIDAGTFDAPPGTLAGWRARLHSLPDAPSLAGAHRFRRDWLIAFLREPTDLRPHLEATMPRLAIDERDARDLAAALRADAAPVEEGAIEGDPTRGRELVEARACGVCHTFAGAPIPARGDPGARGEALARARLLAPDLAVARERLDRGVLVAWLRDPRAVHAETPMPPTGLDAAEARDVARWILDAPIDAPAPTVPARLPILERAVTWEEVEARVFRRVCWHCHADPSFALGDGGPGNTGGFGFPARGLDLSSYPGVRSGARDDHGRRRSVFAEVELPDGTRLPRLVATLRARQLEEAGRPVPGLRGMPLGLPSVSPEALQLVETWIAQGRRR